MNEGQPLGRSCPNGHEGWGRFRSVGRGCRNDRGRSENAETRPRAAGWLSPTTSLGHGVEIVLEAAGCLPLPLAAIVRGTTPEHELDEDRVLTVVLKGLIKAKRQAVLETCLLYTSPSPRDRTRSRMPSSA